MHKLSMVNWVYCFAASTKRLKLISDKFVSWASYMYHHPLLYMYYWGTSYIHHYSSPPLIRTPLLPNNSRLIREVPNHSRLIREVSFSEREYITCIRSTSRQQFVSFLEECPLQSVGLAFTLYQCVLAASIINLHPVLPVEMQPDLPPRPGSG